MRVGSRRRRLGVSVSRENQSAPATAPENLPAAIQAISWKAQVRLCKRYRQLMAKGKHANQVVVAIARELSAFMWAIAKQVVVPPKA